MSDEITNDLKKAFMKDKNNITKNCPTADEISDYAFGEFSPEDANKIEEHLKICRSCLDLYMDIKLAEEDAASVKNKKVEVLPGLQRAIKKKSKSKVSPWGKIANAISEFFGGGFGLKPVATFATVALVIFIGIYVMHDPTPHTPYGIEIMLYGRTQIGFRGGQPEYKEFQVEPGGKLNSGDYFRFQVTIADGAFVYVVFNDSLGNIQALEKGHIAAGNDVLLPDGEKWYQLDDNTGGEKLYLIASKDKIDDFNNRVERLKSDGINSNKIFQII